MNLGTVDLWFPILRLRADVLYQATVTFNPLHKAVLAAANGFSTAVHPFAMLPLSKLFRDVYGLSGAEHILPHILEDLLDWRQIHIRDGGTLGPGTRLADIQVGASSGPVTPRSVQKIDPATAQRRTMERLIDPVSEAIVKKRDLSSNPGFLHIPDAPFHQKPSNQWVHDALVQEVTGHVRIYSTTIDVIETLWSPCKANILLQGEDVVFSVTDPIRDAYLRDVPNSVRRQWLARWHAKPEESVEAVIDADEPQLELSLPAAFRGIVLAYGIPDDELCRVQAGGATMLVSLDKGEPGAPPALRRECTEDSACRVMYHRTMDSVPGTLAWPTEARQMRVIQARWAGAEVKLKVYVKLPSDILHRPDWRAALEDLEAEFRSAESFDMLVQAAYWLPADRFWAWIQDQPESKRIDWLVEALMALMRLPAAVRSNYAGSLTLKLLEDIFATMGNRLSAKQATTLTKQILESKEFLATSAENFVRSYLGVRADRGATRLLKITNELDGPLAMLSDRIRDLLSREAPEFFERLVRERATHISYSDRYVRSPWNVAVLDKLLQVFKSTSLRAIRLEGEAWQSEKAGQFIHDSWQADDDFSPICKMLIQKSMGIEPEITHKKNRLQHDRVLSIRWSSGSSSEIILGQGMGYWRIAGHELFDFRQPPANQAQIINNIQNFASMHHSREGPTHLTVHG